MESSAFTILVVDDDDLVRKTVATLVSALGYNSIQAASGKEALELIKENKDIDLVLTDVMMPGMNGLELLKSIWESSYDIDVIVVTGFAETIDYADAVEAGAVDYLKKPISQRELDAKLHRVFREREKSKRLAILEGKDQRTGLYTRESFSSKFGQEMERAFRQNNSLHLAILEIAEENEQMLADLAAVVRFCIRDKVDMAFRFDQQELAVVLPETTVDQATEIMQRLLLLALERGMNSASLAIGLVSSPKSESIPVGEIEEELVKKAMQAVADSRADGGNTVTCRV